MGSADRTSRRSLTSFAMSWWSAYAARYARTSACPQNLLSSPANVLVNGNDSYPCTPSAGWCAGSRTCCREPWRGSGPCRSRRPPRRAGRRPTPRPRRRPARTPRGCGPRRGARGRRRGPRRRLRRPPPSPHARDRERASSPTSSSSRRGAPDSARGSTRGSYATPGGARRVSGSAPSPSPSRAAASERRARRPTRVVGSSKTRGCRPSGRPRRRCFVTAHGASRRRVRAGHPTPRFHVVVRAECLAAPRARVVAAARAPRRPARRPPATRLRASTTSPLRGR